MESKLNSDVNNTILIWNNDIDSKLSEVKKITDVDVD